jgi:hypothetical protein
MVHFECSSYRILKGPDDGGEAGLSEVGWGGLAEAERRLHGMFDPEREYLLRGDLS